MQVACNESRFKIISMKRYGGKGLIQSVVSVRMWGVGVWVWSAFFGVPANFTEFWYMIRKLRLRLSFKRV